LTPPASIAGNRTAAKGEQARKSKVEPQACVKASVIEARLAVSREYRAKPPSEQSKRLIEKGWEIQRITEK
jgi:hypothetical protein